MIYARNIIPVIFAIIMVAGCKPGVPSKYISPSDMEDILYDYCLAQGVVAGSNTPYEKKKCDLYAYKKEILEKYEVTEAEYDSSMIYYMSNAQRLHEIYENVSERLGNDAVAMGAAASDLDKFGSADVMGDTTNIWKERSTAVLTNFAPYNRIDFFIKADSTYKEGDRLMLDFDNKYIYQDGSRIGIALLSVCYDNDSIVERKTNISSTSNYTINIPSLNGHKIKNIRGFIYHAKKLDSSLTTLKLMILNNIRLIRFHKKENDKASETADTDSLKAINTDSVDKTIEIDPQKVSRYKDTVITNDAF